MPPEVKIKVKPRVVTTVPLGYRFKMPPNLCVRLCTNEVAGQRGVLCLSDMVVADRYMPISVTVFNATDETVEFTTDDTLCDVVVMPMVDVEMKFLTPYEFDTAVDELMKEAVEGKKGQDPKGGSGQKLERQEGFVAPAPPLP